MPDYRLLALRPLMEALVDEPLIIEADLTEEEHAIIEAGWKHYEAHPEDFVSLEDIS
jgi:hypothetical protein